MTANALQPQSGGGYVDGFLAEFSAGGNLVYASYFGGDGYDSVSGIALDGAGNIYLSGVTGGFSEPASAGAFQPAVRFQCDILNPGPPAISTTGDPFVAKLTPNAASISGLTYLGSGCVYSAVVAVDSSGAPWIAGTLAVTGTPFPTASPLQIGIGNGFLAKLQAAYIAKINPAPPAVSVDELLTIGGSTATGNGSPIAPGELLRIIGKNLGPVTYTPGVVNSSGFVTTTVSRGAGLPPPPVR